jgi:hypothetical protein|tara:strand:- start:855 stop:1118 length:264 start_codon:yes stop_codon:yes gene_type:complete
MDSCGEEPDMLHKVYHFAGHDTYVEVEEVGNGWVHTRIMHSKNYNRPNDFYAVYRSVYACPKEDLPGVIAKAQSSDHRLWGSSDEDY